MYSLIDEISELVYVADTENYDLLFMNKAGKSKFDPGDDGPKKCYKVLQGRDTPCDFCTNQKLTQESFYVWEFWNPLVDRHYILKDKLILWEGRIARIEIAFDVTEREQQRLALQNALEVENFVMDCVRILHTGEINDAVNKILKQTGEFLQADRTYIFQISGDRMDNTYEWCARGVEPEIQNLQELPVALINRWMGAFDENRPFFIEDLETIREISPVEYEILNRQNIRSLIAVPLRRKGELAGYIGVDNPARGKWMQIEPVLGTIGYFLISTLERLQADKMLRQFSYFDTLTGLYNRNCYIRDLKQFDSRRDSPVGVVYLDLNGLKNTNDQLGHAAGDQALIDTSRKIQSVFPQCRAYRLGGDEFVVICERISEMEFAGRVRELKNLFLLSANASASMGVRWAENCTDIYQLITKADTMMYEDKQRFYRYNPLTGRYRYNADDALGLTDPARLDQALRENRFFMYLQPKVSFQDCRLIGAEALVRYWNQEGRIVPPDHFIPALEESRIIGKVDFFIFEKACRAIRNWLDEGYEVPPISVNFSRYTLLEKDFIQRVTDIWKKYGIPQSLVELEVTETVENVDSEFIFQIFHDIREAGFSIAIDDFGVKYANLGILLSTDISTLKLDKSLVNDLDFESKSRILVQSLVQICRNMGIQFLVEGVETEKQFKILQELQCDGAQGYLFSKPIPEEEYEEWLIHAERYCGLR